MKIEFSPRQVFWLAAAALVALVGAPAGNAVAQGAVERQPSASSSVDRVNRGLVTIISGRVDSTAARMAADLADVLDDGATRRLLPIIGKGASQGVTDLRLLRGIDLAILQTDVIADYRDRNAFTIVSALHNEELHLLAAEPVRSIQDLAGKKLNVEPAGSGTAVTVANVLEALGISAELTHFEHGVAIEKLKSGEISAIAVVGGRPVPVFTARTVPPGAHFLAVPLTPELARTYTRASLTGEDYPGLVGPQQTVETIAVGAVLAAANLPPDTERHRNMAALVDALFTQFDKLLEPTRHPKWREVNIRAELSGWRRFGPAEAWLRRNPVATPAIAETQLKDIFIRFLEERSKAGGITLTQQRKDELFEQFQRWQQQRPR